MAKKKQKPIKPFRPFYDEEGYKKRNPYIDRVILEYPERIIHPTEATKRKGYWRNWSGNRPIFLEIGPGKGRHLVEHALRFPESVMLGVEVKFRRFYKVAKRIAKAQADNAFMIRFDANFLDSLFDEGEIAEVYVLFPDPWWKKERQQFNRLIDEQFIENVHRILQSGGGLIIKTDHAERFKEYVEFVRNSPFILERKTDDLAKSPYDGQNIQTIFETKFRERGLPVHYLLARKA